MLQEKAMFDRGHGSRVEIFEEHRVTKLHRRARPHCRRPTKAEREAWDNMLVDRKSTKDAGDKNDSLQGPAPGLELDTEKRICGCRPCQVARIPLRELETVEVLSLELKKS